MKISLKPMSELEFQDYVEQSCRSYAQESPRYLGVPLEQAIQSARDEMLTKTLPQGHHTPGHFIWNILNHETRVGFLHLGPTDKTRETEIFAWDFEIFEPFRRKGFAKQALMEAKHHLKKLGYRCVSLNVFGNNAVAIQLYKSIGFHVTQIQMACEIDG